jgi:hypothetical protein
MGKNRIPNKNDHMLMPNGYSTEGAGENLVATAADFENFLEPRTILSDSMEADLEPVIRLLVKNHWPFQAACDLWRVYRKRMLTVFEKVNKDTPFDGLRGFLIMPKPLLTSSWNASKIGWGSCSPVPDVLSGRAV